MQQQLLSNIQILLLTTKLYDEHQYSLIEYLTNDQDIQLVNIYKTGKEQQQKQFKQNYYCSKNPFVDSISEEPDKNPLEHQREWFFQNILPRYNAKCYFIPRNKIQEYKEKLMFMKYQPNQYFVILDEYTDLPYYIETKNCVVKTQNVLDYIKLLYHNYNDIDNIKYKDINELFQQDNSCENDL